MSQSVERALQILERLSSGPQRLTELSKELGVHRTTTWRLLNVLEGHGLVRMVGDNHRYGLGLGILHLSTALLDSLDIRKATLPHLQELSEITKETIHLGMYENVEVVYIDKIASLYPVGMSSRVGARVPAYCTAMGKVLLGYRPESEWPSEPFTAYTAKTITDLGSLKEAVGVARESGYAIDDGENEDTVRCIAAPVLDSRRDAVAAISISAPSSRADVATLEGFLEPLQEAARRASHELGWLPAR